MYLPVGVLWKRNLALRSVDGGFDGLLEEIGLLWGLKCMREVLAIGMFVVRMEGTEMI